MSAAELSPSRIEVESDVQRDAGRALEMLHVQLVSTLIDPYWWKWVLVCLHHVIETFAIASLGVAGPTGPVESIGGFQEPVGTRWTSPSAGGSRLLELVRQVRQSGAVAISDEMDRDLAMLAEYRDAFIDRLPERWTLSVESLPGLSRTCLQFAERIAWSPGALHWHSANVSDRARVKYLASLQILEALDEQYRRQSALRG